MFCIAENWYKLLADEFEKDYYKKLSLFLENEYKAKTIYPVAEKVFNSINHVKFDDVKVVIIGQDPYHEPGQAHGLCFSVENGVELPPSLVNIFKEIESEYGIKNTNGNLSAWAKQGVLLLNSVLTVEKGKANSHKGKGWENITKKIISLLNERKDPVVFMLWGRSAQEIGELVTNPWHLKLKTVHPSPLSAYAGFFGCNHFKLANQFLKNIGKTEIDWRT